jgi:hypothetical protein
MSKEALLAGQWVVVFVKVLRSPDMGVLDQ